MLMLLLRGRRKAIVLLNEELSVAVRTEYVDLYRALNANFVID